MGFSVFFPLSHAGADEFSVLPPNDPIYAQLAMLERGKPSSKALVPLTRYEAALQAARAILDLRNRDSALVARDDWRAITALTNSLKSELRQLGVDIDAARALAAKNLQNPERKSQPTTTPISSAPSLWSNNLSNELKGNSAPTKVRNSEKGRSSLLMAPQVMAGVGSTLERKSSDGSLSFQLSPRLRAETALQAVQRTGLDPLDAARGFSLRGVSDNSRTDNSRTGNSAAADSGATNSKATDSRVESLASQTTLSYDLSRYLTLRAANSRLNWGAATALGTGSPSSPLSSPFSSPLLGVPLFEGASSAGGSGGGVDVNLGAGLKFSTEIERLRANTGASARRIGGGASLSAFQNRLSMNMSLSRLFPQDKTALPSTAAQLGASLDVSQRLSLSLIYQGLFAPTPSNSASRVAGGVSLSF